MQNGMEKDWFSVSASSWGDFSKPNSWTQDTGMDYLHTNVRSCLRETTMVLCLTPSRCPPVSGVLVDERSQLTCYTETIHF